MGKTKIEWSQFSWNPVTGCTPVSEGCHNCYARRMAHRLAGRYGYPKEPHEFDVTLRPDRLNAPLKRKKPTVYFVCSMSDLFHKDIPDEFIMEVFTTMYRSPQHIFQLLTKRPRRMMEFLKSRIDVYAEDWYHSRYGHVWLGVSVENQAAADERIPLLLQTPAAVHYVSVEPMLEPINLHLEYTPPCSHPGCYSHVSHPCEGCGRIGGRLPLDWVICGAESGPGARPMDEDWVRDLKDQCQAADVSFFYKQKLVNGHKVGMPVLDGRTWQEFPK